MTKIKRELKPQLSETEKSENRKKKKAEKDKRYRIKYSEVLKIKKKNYFQQNKKAINAKVLKSLKEKPQNRMAHAIRNRMRRALRGKIKPTSTIKCLGCSLPEFIDYISSKFTINMSFENYGKYWHLDHIKPLVLFDLENLEEYSRACHYTNYQPLEAIENFRKNRFYVEPC